MGEFAIIKAKSCIYSLSLDAIRFLKIKSDDFSLVSRGDSPLLCVKKAFNLLQSLFLLTCHFINHINRI